MQNAAVRKKETEVIEKARIVGLVPLEQLEKRSELPLADNDFLMQEASSPWSGEQLARQEKRLLAEAEELLTACRWEDMVAMFYPLEEKVPELVDAGLDTDIRLKAAFALDHLGRFEDALKLLGPVCREQADHYLAHYNYAYVAYNALYNAKNRRILLHGARKKELVSQAHRHFQICLRLRPDSVTPFYREGVLWQDIENNPGKAMSCFGRAIANWERRSVEDRREKHQERPKYVRALYHLAGCCLSKGQVGRSRSLYEKVIRVDEGRDFIAPVYKYYSLGKALHELGRSDEALEFLETAAQAAEQDQDTDFVYERAARCALELGRPEQAADFIDRIPQGKRRHYVRWTEADALAALGRLDKAKQILLRSAENDRRSKHRALLRLAKISYRQGEMDKALDYAGRANQFCLHTFGNESREITFWQAACFYRLARYEEAMARVEELRGGPRRHPHLNRLEQLIRKEWEKKV